jgi:hypothetical protein
MILRTSDQKGILSAGEHKRVQAPIRIAPAEKSFRQAQKIADEYMRPMNQGLELIGSATNFTSYVETTYIPIVMPLLAKSTQDRYQGIVENYLKPESFNRDAPVSAELRPSLQQAY